VVLTADEDDHNQGNTVLTVVIHRSQRGRVVSSQLTHYSLSGMLSQVTGTAPLGAARTAPSMAAAFRLPLRH
jgi:acid phosphatase